MHNQKGRVSLETWSGREDLNLRHPAPKAGALPGCATPRYSVLNTIIQDISIK